MMPNDDEIDLRKPSNMPVEADKKGKRNLKKPSPKLNGRGNVTTAGKGGGEEKKRKLGGQLGGEQLPSKRPAFQGSSDAVRETALDSGLSSSLNAATVHRAGSEWPDQVSYLCTDMGGASCLTVCYVQPSHHV